MSKVGSPPDHTVLGARLAERTAPIAPQDDQYGWAHAHLAEAMMSKAIQLQEAFDPEDAASFETILDPARCPAWALPWLAQLVGIVLPATADEVTQRQIIAALAPQKRGTTGMLEAAAGLFLTGSKIVYFRERDPDAPDPPYTLEVVTLESQTPDPDAVLRALMSQKPGGIILNYRTVEGWDYQQLHTEALANGWVYGDLGDHFATYADLAANRQTGAP